jgi:hypothetical protein
MGSGAKGGIGGGGLSPDDINLITQALGQNTGMMDARYAQLGEMQPSPGTFGGNPATAAAAGGSLAGGAKSTANITDDRGLASQAGAALGQLQTANASNPAIAGTAANMQQQNQGLSGLLSQFGFNQGAQSVGGTGGTGGTTGVT